MIATSVPLGSVCTSVTNLHLSTLFCIKNFVVVVFTLHLGVTKMFEDYIEETAAALAILLAAEGLVMVDGVISLDQGLTSVQMECEYVTE